jgi:hypothetical protein
MKNPARLLIFMLILTLCFVFSCGQKEKKAAVEEEIGMDLQLDKIPQAVMDGLKAKFPQAEIQKWTQEKEGEIAIYNFEFTQESHMFKAVVGEDGSIHNWQKAVETTDLPEVVKVAVETKYPGSTMKEIMEISTVSEGQDVLEGFEFVLETSDMKEVEVMVAPGGAIVEYTGEMQPEEE